MNEITLALLAAFVVVFCAVARPHSLRAPRGWYFEGVRSDGATTIRRAPISDDDVSDATIDARIHCTGGAVAIVVDHRHVGCQGGWRR